MFTDRQTTDRQLIGGRDRITSYLTRGIIQKIGPPKGRRSLHCDVKAVVLVTVWSHFKSPKTLLVALSRARAFTCRQPLPASASSKRPAPQRATLTRGAESGRVGSQENLYLYRPCVVSGQWLHQILLVSTVKGNTSPRPTSRKIQERSPSKSWNLIVGFASFPQKF